MMTYTEAMAYILCNPTKKYNSPRTFRKKKIGLFPYLKINHLGVQ